MSIPVLQAGKNLMMKSINIKRRLKSLKDKRKRLIFHLLPLVLKIINLLPI
jgi:hypothetical protein